MRLGRRGQDIIRVRVKVRVKVMVKFRARPGLLVAISGLPRP